MTSAAWTVITCGFIILSGFSGVMAYYVGQSESAKALQAATSDEATHERFKKVIVQRFISMLINSDSRTEMDSFFPQLFTVDIDNSDYERIVEAHITRRSARDHLRAMPGDPYYYENYEQFMLVLLHRQHKEKLANDIRMVKLLTQYWISGPKFVDETDEDDAAFYEAKSLELYERHRNEDTAIWFRTVCKIEGAIDENVDLEQSVWGPKLKRLFDDFPKRRAVLREAIELELPLDKKPENWDEIRQFVPVRSVALAYFDELESTTQTE